MPEQESVARLQPHEEFIQKRAHRFAGGDPLLAEDLAQEARQAAWQKLENDPHCPDSHLVVIAKDAIYEYRRRGSSVDGKLNEGRRSRQYQIFSFEESHDDCGLIETVADPGQSQRPAEEQALASLNQDALHSQLTDDEQQALTLSLQGCSWSEIGKALGCTGPTIDVIRQTIQHKALTIWQHPAPRAYPPQRTNGAAVQRSADLSELSPAVLAALSESQQRAVKAYQQGATQQEAAEQAGLSQSTVSRLIRFVREASAKPPEAITPRRYKRANRRTEFLALFAYLAARQADLPDGKAGEAGATEGRKEPVTHEELLTFFSDVKDPEATLRATIARCNRQLQGARIVKLEEGGYVLIRE